MANSMLIDTSKCTACRGCQVACKQWNQLPAEKTTNKGSYENPPALTAKTWTKVGFKETGQNGQVEWLFAKRQCFHCTDPTCAKVCPTGAVKKTDYGAVVIDEKKCSGCKFCVQNCPFEVPQYDESANTVKKCWLCFDRISNGLDPACAKTCPTGAIQFGKRNELISGAKDRIALLVDRGFKKASLYGENELGGLGVMYILTADPTVYGLPDDPQVPASAVLWQDILKPAGAIAGGVTVVALAASFLLNLGYERKTEKGGG
jgi:formate dehydrogenase iron-sulfur subunit